MRTTRESANGSRAAHEVEAVLAEMRAARAAARRLGVDIVQRGPEGEWRAAAGWQGSREQTEAADRRLRLRLAARQLPAPTGSHADRARRLRVAEAEAASNPLALGRRETDPPLRSFLLGFGAPR